MTGTKIVCTIGPASHSPEILRRMIEAGMDVARLNFSHGNHSFHRGVLADIRRVSQELGRPTAVLQDLAGPKIRIGVVADGGITLQTGSSVTLTGEDVEGTPQRISTSHPDLASAVRAGDPVLLADGDLELEVLETSGSDIRCRVVIGGSLSSFKGINLPTRSLENVGMTDKDRDDLLFGLENGVDYVAVSFVRTARDIEEVRRVMETRNTFVPLIAKIEKHEALANIGEIIDAADGVMVARGDLGVEIPLEQVPLVQKDLIRRANRAGIPVITATQMLRSMVESPRPTRAEVTDVANAVLDGTDAVMLSEETAMGIDPVRAVAFMRKINLDVEEKAASVLPPFHVDGDRDMPVPEAVGYAACRLAERCGAAAIITFTRSGSTARLVAKYRPPQPILAPTPSRETCRRLSLVRGVVPLLTEDITDTDAMIRNVFKTALASGWVERGKTVVVTSGAPGGPAGTTNLIQAEILD